ncbi:MAG: SDR family oxidoreductase [Bacteroidetes bacterium]|nr:SDR family oxidoreductase [Bacteroidota bacterium]
MNIVVTGVSRGIGYELVKLLSTDSQNTVLAVSRNVKKLEQLKKECLLANASSKVVPIVCDLSDSIAITRLVSVIPQHVSSVNILINNAGTIVNKPFTEISITDLQRVYTVNVFAIVQLIQQLLPLMSTKQKAHVVNIGSMGGFQGSAKFAGLSVYTSSKAALACLTECLAEEFKDKNIAFNCLALGAAQTEMLNEAFPGYKAPLTAEEMATYIAQFSLTAHQYINGKTIPVSLSTP